MSTAKTWEHPQLGRFTFNGCAWEGTVSAPGFDAFVYESHYGKRNPLTGSYELTFEAEDESELPSEVAVAVAIEVAANHAALVPAVTAALWEDFNGRGADSGMWWHDDLESVCEDIEPTPENADDLLKLLRLHWIVIQKDADGYDKPVAMLDFGAEFEEEHGVGILTDGKTVLGAGYAADVSAYKSPV